MRKVRESVGGCGVFECEGQPMRQQYCSLWMDLRQIDELGLFKEDDVRLHGKFVTAVDLELPAEGDEVPR